MEMTQFGDVASGDTSPASDGAVSPGGRSEGSRSPSFYQRRKEHGNDFQITIPWSPQMYFSVRGAENFHIYLWIMKDLAWTQKWYVVSWIFGLSAISWCVVLVYHAFADRNYNEMYMLCALILWLSANFVWMAGKSLVRFCAMCRIPPL
jgi:hypothetical protein